MLNSSISDHLPQSRDLPQLVHFAKDDIDAKNEMSPMRCAYRRDEQVERDSDYGSPDHF